MLSFFSRGVLDEILNLIESVSEGFPSYSYECCLHCLSVTFLITVCIAWKLFSDYVCIAWQRVFSVLSTLLVSVFSDYSLHCIAVSIFSNYFLHSLSASFLIILYIACQHLF